VNLGGYEIEGKLGQGGFGEVYAGRQLALDRKVAIKISTTHRSESAVKRLEREAKVIARFDHPNIIQIYDFKFESDGKAYIVFEYIEGASLSQLIGTYSKLSHQETCYIIKNVALALQYAHSQGVIHRDIKPGNIMVRKDGFVKLLDFGLSRPDADSGETNWTKITATNFVVGTPQYMAPEQALGTPETAASDIFSLGICGYELVSGRSPYQTVESKDLLNALLKGQRLPLRKAQSRLPASYLTLIEKILEQVPTERPGIDTIIDQCQLLLGSSELEIKQQLIQRVLQIDLPQPESLESTDKTTITAFTQLERFTNSDLIETIKSEPLSQKNFKLSEEQSKFSLSNPSATVNTGLSGGSTFKRVGLAILFGLTGWVFFLALSDTQPKISKDPIIETPPNDAGSILDKPDIQPISHIDEPFPLDPVIQLKPLPEKAPSRSAKTNYRNKKEEKKSLIEIAKSKSKPKPKAETETETETEAPTIKLMPPLKLTIRSTVKAEISVDGQVIKKSDRIATSKNLIPGRHKISVRIDGKDYDGFFNKKQGRWIVKFDPISKKFLAPEPL
jgi:serine/threonine protein kinase